KLLYLTNNPNNPTNTIAVYNCCIRKYGGLEIAQLKPKYCTVNRAHLCCTHLSKCEAFRETYSEESKTNESVNLHTNSVISTILSHSSINSQQFAISNFLCRSLLANDLLWFEQLLLRMIVSNTLPFTFVENEDTIAIFEFLIPGLKLPKRKVIDGKVLMKSTQLKWIEFGEHEHQFENKDDEILLSSEWDSDFSLGG
ncbi:1560_t:CDS:2, partial [Gigaspora margarita]